MNRSVEEILTSKERTQEFISGKLILVNVWAYNRNIEAILMALNDKPGIYAWYRHRELRNLSANDVFSEIKSSGHPLTHPKDRKISNFSNIDVISEIPDLLSEKDKTKILRNSTEYFMQDQVFCDAVNDSIRFSLLFDSPLYIGASKHIKTRIGKHLKGKTGLANRLNTGNFEPHRKRDYIPIDILQTKLLIMYIDDMDETLVKERSEKDTKSPDKTLEHLTQLLYRPPFVERLG